MSMIRDLLVKVSKILRNTNQTLMEVNWSGWGKKNSIFIKHTFINIKMNRFEYGESKLLPNETYIRRDVPVRLYDGDVKVMFSQVTKCEKKKQSNRGRDKNENLIIGINIFYVIICLQTNFEMGELVLTNYRLLWARPGDIPRGQSCLCLPLSCIVFYEEESPGAFSFGRSKKVVLHLAESTSGTINFPINHGSA